jgi:phosphoglucomutase/phosphomannomutase
LNDKLKYFEIEDKIVTLKNTSDARGRKNELEKLLLFLGANPVEKVDNAFREKYGTGMLEYLNLGEGED